MRREVNVHGRLTFYMLRFSRAKWRLRYLQILVFTGRPETIPPEIQKEDCTIDSLIEIRYYTVKGCQGRLASSPHREKYEQC